MKLVRRSTVGQYLDHDVTEYIEAHIDGMMKIHRYDYLAQSPRVLQDLTVKTKTWIAEKTAYAIFSHRWLNIGELTFQDILKFNTLSVPGFRMVIDHKSDRKIFRGIDILDQVNAYSTQTPKNRDDHLKLLEVMKELCGDMSDVERRDCQDFVKLVEFFNISSKYYGCKYVWFDSGCIDKSSSTELEESIRSMFNWYRNSKICIVHLADTTSISDLGQDPWFTRGWTLQELLAPKRVKFFRKSWQPLTLDSINNDKDSDFKVSLWRIISFITRIPLPTLLDFTPGINHARDALVWVSNRKTTRIEDIAYCLIGLLGIPFSIAYGEGNMAFRRLQVEILQHSHDMGLFAWTGQPSTYNSMLAEGPQCFSEPFPSQSHLQPLSTPKSQTVTNVFDPTYALTNYGLRIPLSIYTVRSWEVCHVPNLGFTLRAEKLGVIQALELIAKSPNLEEYDYLKIALLADLVTTTAQYSVSYHGGSIAILLGYKDGRYKRIPTEKHIILSHPTEGPTAPEMIFIE